MAAAEALGTTGSASTVAKMKGGGSGSSYDHDILALSRFASLLHAFTLASLSRSASLLASSDEGDYNVNRGKDNNNNNPVVITVAKDGNENYRAVGERVAAALTIARRLPSPTDHAVDSAHI